MSKKRTSRFREEKISLPGPVEASLLLALGSTLAAVPAFAEDSQTPNPPPPELSAADKDSTTSVSKGQTLNGIPMQEITVTARHRNESIQDVPLSVSVLGGEEANTQKVEAFTEFAQHIPNLNPNTANPRTSSVSIRGIGGIQGGSDGSESGVGLIVDDVFFTHIGFAWQDYVDLESVEVARGPQGTLLGKNTTVGALKINTQKPSFTPSATFETSYGSFNTVSERANVTGPIIPDKIAFRATYYGTWGDGTDVNNGTTFFVNPKIPNAPKRGYEDQAHYQNADRWGVRAQLLFTPTDTISDRVIFDRLGSEEYNNYSRRVPDTYLRNQDGTVPTSFNQLVKRTFGIDVSQAFAPNQPDQGSIATKTLGFSNNFNWDLGGTELTSVSAYRQFLFNPHNSTGIAGISYSSGCACVDVSQASEELRWASTGKRVVDWTTGIYFLRENVHSPFITTYGSDAAQIQFGKNANPLILNGLTTTADGSASTTSAAIFAQPTWHIDDQLSLTLGLRETYERRRGSNLTSFSTGTPPSALTGPGVPNSALSAADLTSRIGFLENRSLGFDSQGNGAYTSGAASRNSLSYIVNPSYKLNENANFYFLYGVGEKSGAVNINATPITTQVAGSKDPVTGAPVVRVLGTFPTITKPEKAHDYEVGVKTEWFGKTLSLNGDLFLEDIDNYQSSVRQAFIDTITGVQNYVTFYSNVGGVQTSGYEIDGRWRPLEGLSIDFGAGYTKAVFTDYKNAAAPPDLANNKVKVNTVDLTNTALPNVPVHNLNIGVSYEHPVAQAFGKDVNGFIYANENWRDTTDVSALGFANDPLRVRQSPYSIVNVGFGIRSEDDRYSLTFWGKNIFDRSYITSASINSIGSGDYSTVGLGIPAAFGVTLRVKFF